MTPYRIMVSATGMLPYGRRGKLRQVHYGYMGWTADQTAEPHRLPGSGTFLYAGLRDLATQCQQLRKRIEVAL